MNLVLRAPLEEERFLGLLQWIGLAIVGGVFCFVAFFLLGGRQSEHWQAQVPADPVGRHFAYERIGSGALALSGSGLSPLFAALSREIFLLGKNTRPDAGAHEVRIGLCLGGSGEQRFVKSGTPVFLDLQVNESGEMVHMGFASEPTQVWITPRDIESGNVLIEVGQSPLFAGVEQQEFVLKPSPKEKKRENSAFMALQTARVLGQDLFFARYGAEKYRALAQKQKVEIYPSMVFLQQGDFLSWKNGKWVSGSEPSAPLAIVKKIEGTEIVLQAWDETGFESTEIRVPHKNREHSLPKIDKYLSSVRRRSANQVTALLGGKRVILKKGDWVLKTKNGWRNLRSLQDIQAYLNNELVGQLFVLESIENAADGKPVIMGNFFDETRTQIEPIYIAINQDRANHKGKLRRKK